VDVGRRDGPDAEQERTRTAPPSMARRSYLDNIRTLLIVVIIVVHAVIGYADFSGAWPYSDVAERYLSWPTVVVVFGAASPFLILMIAMLFLAAGLVTPASLDRKGPGRFARGRLLRLGLPFAVFLLFWPALEYALYRPLGHVSGSFWAYLRGTFPDSGPVWFVGVLLLFSVGYAAVRSVRRQRPVRRPLTTPVLLGVAGLVAVGSFVVRLAWPYGAATPLNLNEWQWPECLALFAVGIRGAREGWLAAVPEGLARQARTTTVLTGLVLAVFLVASLPFGLGPDDILGGLHVGAAVLASAEGLLTVFGCVWALAVAQRRLDRSFRRSPELARAAFAAFLVQGPVLIGLAVLLRPLPVSAGVKALTVAVLGVTLSFWLGRLLVTRVPVLARVL
jgi:hypothetical protein